MEWIGAENPPDDTRDVLVSDGYESYAVAYYRPSDKKWFAATDLLDAENYDGGCRIYLDGDIKWWQDIAPHPEEVI